MCFVKGNQLFILIDIDRLDFMLNQIIINKITKLIIKAYKIK